MSGKPSNPRHFWQEMKRCKVIRVVIFFAIVAYVVIKLANNTFPALDISDWALRLFKNSYVNILSIFPFMNETNDSS